MITLLLFIFLGGGWCLICLIVFGCEATDWLRDIWSPVKDIALGDSVVILDGASVVQILKGVEASTIQ